MDQQLTSKMDGNDRLVSPREFAETTGLKTSAIYQLFQLGKLDAFQVVQRGNIRIWLNSSLNKLKAESSLSR